MNHRVVASADVLPFIPSESQLAARKRSGITVRHPDNNESAFYVTPREAQVLSSAGFVEGSVWKGELSYLRLKVAMRAALRLLSPMQVGACKGITKRKQSRGAKHWVPHFERSEAGYVGSHSRIVFPLACREQTA